MRECPCESEMLDLLVREVWEDPELRRHVESCETCADLLVVVRALQEDHQRVCHDARVPSAGVVWWRAIMRARAEATRAVEQPLTIAQAIGGAAVIALACTLASFVWPAVSSLPHPTTLVLVVLGLAVCLVLAPLAVVLAFTKD